MDNEKTIGQKIARLRQEKGLSRVDFSDIMAVSVQAVGKWERGESLPDIMTMKKISEVLGAKIDCFFDCQSAQCAADNEQTDSEEDAHDEKPPQKKLFWNMSASSWKDADFSNLKNLADKFKGSNILNCKFCGSELSGITFRSNNIRKCDFSGADLSNAKISMCNMVRTDFSHCDFKNSVIKMCNVQNGDFSSSDFGEAEISGTSISRSSFDKTRFTNTSFKGVAFNKITISGDIIDCSFVGCLFRNSEFIGATFRNTFFKNQNIKNAKFIDCKADRLTYSFLKSCKANVSTIELIE